MECQKLPLHHLRPNSKFSGQIQIIKMTKECGWIYPETISAILTTQSQDTSAMMAPLPTLEYFRFGIGFLKFVTAIRPHNTRGVWKDAPRFDITRVTQSHTPGPKSQCSGSWIQVGAIGNGRCGHRWFYHILPIATATRWFSWVVGNTGIRYRENSECFQNDSVCNC